MSGLSGGKDAVKVAISRGKAIVSELKKVCPSCADYYNPDIDGFEIPVDVYNNTPSIVDEIFNLVHMTGNYGLGPEYWVMYARIVDGVDTLYVTLADL